MEEGRELSKFDHTVRDHLKTVLEKKTSDRTLQGTVLTYPLKGTNAYPYLTNGTGTTRVPDMAT